MRIYFLKIIDFYFLLGIYTIVFGQAVRMAFLDYSTAAALAATSRALKDYNKTLDDRCLAVAKRMWDE